GAGPARPGVGGDDVENVAGNACLHHPGAEGMRAVEGSVEHDVDHGAPAVGREPGRRYHEIARSVVDEDLGGAAEAVGDLLRHAVHRLRVPDVEDPVGHLAACGRSADQLL